MDQETPLLNKVIDALSLDAIAKIYQCIIEMPTTDRSNTARTHYKMGQTVSAFRTLNPTRRLEGPQGMTPSSTLTSVHIGERPFIRDSVTIIPCCSKETPECGPLNLSAISTLVDNTYTMTTNATIPTCYTVTVPIGFAFVIPAEITLVVNGTFRVYGTLIVNGQLINNSFQSVNVGEFRITPTGIFINNGAATIDQLSQDLEAVLIARGVSTLAIGSIKESIVDGSIVLEEGASFTVNPNSTVTFSASSTLTGAAQTLLFLSSGAILNLETPPANLTLGAISGSGGVSVSSPAIAAIVAGAGVGAGVTITSTKNVNDIPKDTPVLPPAGPKML
jgi:hypothetical protein